MTAIDRFDPFERRITDAIDEIAGARVPDYLDDLLQLTARSSQRPRWTFLERWLPMDTTLARPVLGRNASLRPLIVLALLTALVAGAIAAYVGTRQRLPEPFGPAANGQLAYPAEGDLYVREGLHGEGRLLVGGDGEQGAPAFSPDGTRIAYATTTGGQDHFMIADADGTNARELARIPPGNAWAAWAPDSRRMALVHDVDLRPTLSIVDTDTGESTVVPFENMLPIEVAWRPPSGAALLVKARIQGGDEVGLFTMRPDGSGLRSLGLPGETGYGPQWTLSGSTWSPDGSSIAFNLLQPDPARAEWYFRTALVDPDGGNLRVLQPAEDTPLFNQGWPVFSPDGQRIVMETWLGTADGSVRWNQLAIAPADGSAPARLVGPQVPDQTLVKIWSPDGSRVIVSLEGEATLYAVDPTSGASELLPFSGELPDWQRLAR